MEKFLSLRLHKPVALQQKSEHIGTIKYQACKATLGISKLCITTDCRKLHILYTQWFLQWKYKHALFLINYKFLHNIKGVLVEL